MDDKNSLVLDESKMDNFIGEIRNSSRLSKKYMPPVRNDMIPSYIGR